MLGMSYGSISMWKWVFRECHITTVIYHLGCIMFSKGDLRPFHLYVSVEVENKPVFVIRVGVFFLKCSTDGFGKVIWPLNFADS